MERVFIIYQTLAKPFICFIGFSQPSEVASIIPILQRRNFSELSGKVP